MGQTPAQVEQGLADVGIGSGPKPTSDEISSNFYWTLGKENVFNIQTTVRGAMTAGQVKQHLDTLTEALKMVVNQGGHAKQVGRPDLTPNAAAPTPPGNGNGAPPPPPAGAPVASGPSESACAMIEVATSYTGGKPQLKFHVNGMEHPLTFTRDVSEMVKLLTPLGFTPLHIVVGQKYPVNCIVTWQQSDKYRNVLSVRKVA